MQAQIGPYRVREKLSEGAIATLYRAEHERLGRVAIVKALKGTLAEGSPLGSALGREARILAKMGHASVVRCLDVSPGSGATWVALEDVPGPRLAAVLARTKRLPHEVAMAIALGVASGLGHAHARGIVHRDVRPEGIALAPDGRSVLVDFGAAMDLSAPAAPSPFDGSERLSGPEYAAPEQIVGEPASPRSDVFSLGVVLYEMLAGARPWDEGAEGREELARRVRSQEPQPLDRHGIVLPRGLSRIVMRCLAKRPEDRFEDGDALAEALAEALDEATRDPSRKLVTRALALSFLGEEIGEEKGRRQPKKGPPPLPLGPLAQRLAVLFGLVVVGAVVVEGFVREEDVTAEPASEADASERGYVKVLARPWAEVLVDGRYVDVTPIGRPIPVVSGRHYVTFKHPNAPDEKREIRVIAGQTVLLDVTMRIERRAAPVGADAGTDAGDSP
ncbi:serine/threonine-protein kinase [Polyangium mundeleinium]|uniref:Serine/threonine protein kinase n=1 Tax=Polyangium mundeleinium TaxID=2995306 RepID=A0ABT5EMG6_9BACT|nr:serine/threonine-protein kinase [Polyangium mundeleinium]MDC0742383.1 serine/threonine protein kinase [Polyangium mundeleinium]